MKTNKPILSALAACSMMALAACGSNQAEETNATGEVESQTLAALIDEADDISVASDILSNSGLRGVFDGAAPYTIFAPTDEAFEQIDIPLEDEEARAARVAIMREHIVPGFLTLDDIVTAVQRAGGSVEMQTMGSNTLTFSGDADDLVITSSDGSEAHVSGAALSGANGTVFPVDGVLKSMESSS